MLTFYRKAQEYSNTVMLIKDEHGYVFGAFCTAQWEQSYRFFGTGDNLLFSFQGENDPCVYRWSGESD